MNYYEELGIKADADEEEIRKAHRRLVKLMHPDHQRDQNLKMLAETQMRRLNSIVSVLLDPEEREEYDEELRGLHNVKAPVQTAWRSVPWWIASTLGAVLLTVGGVWFYADHVGSGRRCGRNPVYIPPQESTQSTRPDVPVRPTTGVEDPNPPVASLDGPTTRVAPPADGYIRNASPAVSTASVPDSSKPAAIVPDNKQELAEKARIAAAAKLAELKAATEAADRVARENNLREEAEKAKAAELIKARQVTPPKVTQLAQTKPDGVPKPKTVPPKTESPKRVFNLPANVQVASARLSTRRPSSLLRHRPACTRRVAPREDPLAPVAPLPIR